LGPDACFAEIAADLRAHNPELLNMAVKCANDVGNSEKVMIGFGMFYRLLIAEAAMSHELLSPESEHRLNPLPRVTPETRESLVEQIDARGTDAFTMESIAELERGNPELLQMAHNFASSQPDYVAVMQGFALLYASLVAQSRADRVYIQ
jgi:hypothetical protein